MPKAPLRGVIAAIATPIDNDGTPDFSLFADHAEQLFDEGCDALNVLGTTGEAVSFSLDQRLGLMGQARARFTKGKMMVGTGAAAVDDAVRLTRAAGELGFEAALVLPPFYYKSVPDDGILRYFEAIAEASQSTDIPLYLYNFPALSGVAYTKPLVEKLKAAFGTRIAGLKDSSGDMAYARSLADIADFRVFPSNEACLLDAHRGEFAGCISATANVNAAFCAKAFQTGDAAALATASEIRALFDGRALVPAIKALVSHIRGLKPYVQTKPPLTDMAQGDLAKLVTTYKAVG